LNEFSYIEERVENFLGGVDEIWNCVSVDRSNFDDSIRITGEFERLVNDQTSEASTTHPGKHEAAESTKLLLTIEPPQYPCLESNTTIPTWYGSSPGSAVLPPQILPRLDVSVSISIAFRLAMIKGAQSGLFAIHSSVS
jgi:hypothetical protein